MVRGDGIEWDPCSKDGARQLKQELKHFVARGNTDWLPMPVDTLHSRLWETGHEALSRFCTSFVPDGTTIRDVAHLEALFEKVRGEVKQEAKAATEQKVVYFGPRGEPRIELTLRGKTLEWRHTLGGRTAVTTERFKTAADGKRRFRRLVAGFERDGYSTSSSPTA